MTKRKKNLLPTFKIYDANSSLDKEWFVYWYEGKKRRKRMKGINQHSTVAKRYQAANDVIKVLKAEHIRKVSGVEAEIWAYIDKHKSNWRKKTLQQYHSSAKMFINFLGGRDISQKLIVEFFDQLRDEKHPTTYNRYLAYVKRLLSAAGYSFYFEDIKREKSYPTPAKYFQHHQAQYLLEQIDKENEELGLFVRFVYFCIGRPNEIRLLKVGDVLIDEMQVRIEGNISKSKKTRFPVIPKAFQPYLKQLFYRPPGEYIFRSPRQPHKPIGVNTMYHRHLLILQTLNFGPGYSLYSWRHTGAVRAAKAGISIKEIQIQLDHHSLDQTDQYLRQMGVKDLEHLSTKFPSIKD